MPRRNKRSDDHAEHTTAELDEDRARRGAERVVSSPDGQWSVRHISVGGATKTYRCPGCEHEIPPAVAHVVAWPADGRGDLADRRHWHTGCWNSRGRRGLR